MNSSEILNTSTNSQPKWKGYTLDELRYRRAITAVAIEIEKDRLQQQLSKIAPGAVGARTSSKAMLSKVLGALNYVDYAMLAFTIGRKLMRLRRHSR